MKLGQFLAAHPTRLWIQFPGEEAARYPSAALARTPPAHRSREVLVTRHLDAPEGHRGIEELAVGDAWWLPYPDSGVAARPSTMIRRRAWLCDTSRPAPPPRRDHWPTSACPPRWPRAEAAP